MTSSSKSDRYLVTKESMKYRVALLINNRDFKDRRNTRYGSEIDMEDMDQLLSKLGYQVLKHNNLSKEGIENALKAFAKHPNLKHTDSVFVVLMSHGDLGKIFGSDEKWFEIDKAYEILNNKNCPVLYGTPKVLLIQACRGHEGGSTEVADCVRTVHLESDFTSLRASTRHTVSYRDTDKGAIFIQNLVKVFNKNYRRDHINELYRQVMREFDDYPWQMPTVERETLEKKFFLVPDEELI